MLDVHHCVTNHPKTQQLKTAHIYYLTVYVRQEFEPGLMGPSASGSLTCCNKRLSQVLS